MDLHVLMREFSQMGDSLIGRGPKHPKFPKPELQTEINDFLEKNLFLKKDQGYIEFLEVYSGATVCLPSQEDCNSSVGIYGFCLDVSFSIARPDYDLLSEDGYFNFADAIMCDDQNIDNDYVDYVFDATGQRSQGVYMRRGDDCTWYCNTFLEWLKDIVNDKGDLRENK